MESPRHDRAIAAIAAAIGEPARARMLSSLLDGRARTGTELAVIAGVTPSTASVHLNRLKAQRLVKVLAQGKHRYFSLERHEVADALEALSVLAGETDAAFVPNTPFRLRAARTCYDHLAGTLGVSLYERMLVLRWLAPPPAGTECELTPKGRSALEAMGIDVESARRARRRFAFACLDWSERRPHLGGALAATLLQHAVRRKWLDRDLDSRIVRVTAAGRRELPARFGLTT